MWHHMMIFLQVWKPFSLYYNWMMLTGLWVDCSKTWQNTGSYLAKLFTAYCARGQGSCIKFLIFIVFIFTYRALIWNIQKFAPCQNFPLYGTCTRDRVIRHCQECITRKQFQLMACASFSSVRSVIHTFKVSLIVIEMLEDGKICPWVVVCSMIRLLPVLPCYLRWLSNRRSVDSGHFHKSPWPASILGTNSSSKQSFGIFPANTLHTHVGQILCILMWEGDHVSKVGGHSNGAYSDIVEGSQLTLEVWLSFQLLDLHESYSKRLPLCASL